MTRDEFGPQEAEMLLAGALKSEPSPLTAFLDALRAESAREIPAELEERHLALIRSELAGSTAPHPRRRGPFPSKPRLAMRSVTVKAVVAVFVVMIAGGALAAAGKVPAVQNQLADAMKFIVDLPGGSDDDAPEPVRTVRPTTEPSRMTTQDSGVADNTETHGSNETSVDTTADFLPGAGSTSGSSSGSSSTTVTEQNDSDSTNEPSDVDTTNDAHDDPPEVEEPDFDD